MVKPRPLISLMLLSGSIIQIEREGERVGERERERRVGGTVGREVGEVR